MKKLLIFLLLIVAFAFTLSAQRDVPKKYSKVLNDQLIVSQGIVKGMTFETRFGNNSAVGSTEEVIQPQGGNYTWQTTPQHFKIAAGGDVTDSITGTGARTVEIRFLDSLWNVQHDTLTLNGVGESPDSTRVPAIRMCKARVLTTGTYGGTNTGRILIVATNLDTVGWIAATDGVTSTTVCVVPNNTTAYLIKLQAVSDSSNESTISFNIRGNSEDFSAPYQAVQKIRTFQGISGNLLIDNLEYIRIPERTDMWFTAAKTSGGGTPTISAQYEMIFVANRYNTFEED